MRLSLYKLETGLETIGGNPIPYDLGRDEAFSEVASIDGPALLWQVDADKEKPRLQRPTVFFDYPISLPR